jgi:hypothetical protein
MGQDLWDCNAAATFTAPEVSSPSIASSAMLVQVTLKYWLANKLDKDASKEVSAAKNADDGVAQVRKKLLANCAELKAVKSYMDSIRHFVINSTLPWSDAGPRLLLTARYFDFHRELTAMFNRLDTTLLPDLEAALGWEIAQAAASQGDLFNANDYPEIGDIMKKFSYSLQYIPLPDAGDFRVDIGNEALTELKERYAAAYQTQIGAAMNSIWHKAHTALTHMAERLDYVSKDDKKVFRDSLIDNVLEIIGLLGECNIANDPKMQLMEKQLRNAMSGITPDALRDDDHLRTETREKINAAIAALPQLDF